MNENQLVPECHCSELLDVCKKVREELNENGMSLSCWDVDTLTELLSDVINKHERLFGKIDG